MSRKVSEKGDTRTSKGKQAKEDFTLGGGGADQKAWTKETREEDSTRPTKEGNKEKSTVRETRNGYHTRGKREWCKSFRKGRQMQNVLQKGER